MADLAVAVLLAVVLFARVMGLFHAMRYVGWSVDAQAMAQQFVKDPGAAEVNWIMRKALTNGLPTLLHWGLACAGLWSGGLLRDARFAAKLEGLQVADSRGDGVVCVVRLRTASQNTGRSAGG